MLGEPDDRRSLAAAMVATKGLGRPFLPHFAVDLVVFASIALVST